MEKVYRDGPIGPGRYREFYQCDIDVVGPKSMKAEAELLEIVKAFFKKYELDVVINVNNIKVLNISFVIIAKEPSTRNLCPNKKASIKMTPK
jgi:histidyl-tRNA synthetase